MLPYNFRPSRPKAAYRKANSRLTRNESMFHVQRGVVSPQKRDINQLNDSRNRSCLHRGTNVFKTKSERYSLTLGEQDINQKSPQPMTTISIIHTWPAGQPTRQFAPKCFEYVQNYHHYKLDINKLDKGQQIPYLSSSQPTITTTTNYPPKRSTGLPKRTPKSASQSRRGSGFRKSADPHKGSTLQELIVAEIQDTLDDNRHSVVLQQSSYTELKVPLATPADSPRSSVVHSTIPDLPQSSPRNGGVNTDTHKPYLSPFITRMPPLKSYVASANGSRRSAKSRPDDHMPDYQRYRILCDAFRPCTPHRHNDRRTRPVSTQVLDYYAHIVNRPIT